MLAEAHRSGMSPRRVVYKPMNHPKHLQAKLNAWERSKLASLRACLASLAGHRWKRKYDLRMTFEAILVENGGFA